MRGDDVVSVFGARREEELLAYLALSSPSFATRQELASSIWPELPETEARRRISMCVFKIKGTLSELGVEEPIETARMRLRLSPTVQVDAHGFLRSLAMATESGAQIDRVFHLNRAVRMYGRGLLPGFDFAWLEPRRSEYSGLYGEVTELLAGLTQDQEGMRDLVSRLPGPAWQRTAAPSRSDRLDAAVSASLVGRVDLDEVQSFAAEAADGLATGDSMAWARKIAVREAEILHCADLMIAEGEYGEALEMIAPLWRYFYLWDRKDVGLQALELALSEPFAYRGETLARAHMAAGNLAFDVGRRAAARDYLSMSLEYWQRQDNLHETFRAYANVGRAHFGLGDFELAVEHYERARTIASALRDAEQLLITLLNLSRSYFALGDSKHAHARALERMTILEESGRSGGIDGADTLVALAAALLLTSDYEAVVEKSRRARKIYDANLHVRGSCEARLYEGRGHYLAGRLDTALELFDSVAEGAREIGHPWTLGYALGYQALATEMIGGERASALMWEALALLEESGDTDSVQRFVDEIAAMRAGRPA